MYLQTGTTQIFLFFLLALLAQGCSTYRAPCSAYIQSREYQTAPDHKAIAQYFDRETKQPPGRLGDVSNECWYISEADSREVAGLAVLEACNNGLRELDKFTKWNCELVAEGNQYTFTEKLRLLEEEERSPSYANQREIPMHVNQSHQGSNNENRTSTRSPRSKDKN